MEAVAVDASRSGMLAEATADGAGSSGAGMVPSTVRLCAPATKGRVGAFQGVVAKGVAVVALGELIKAQSTFSPKGGGKGGQTFRVVVKVRYARASDGDNGSGGRFPSPSLVGSEPSGLFGECKSSVVGG